MIYTLTLNPAIDCFEKLDKIEIGKSNRAVDQRFSIGGKGVNVSIMLDELGVPSIPLYVLGGFTGKFFQSEINKTNLKGIAFTTDVPTRINFKLCGKVETAFDVLPRIPKDTLLEIHNYLKKSLRKEDYLVVSGSGNAEDYFELLDGIECSLIIDAPGKVLKKLMKLKPFLVKPNLEELKDFDQSADFQIEGALAKMIASGPEMILCTLGPKGSILKTKDKEYRLPIIGRDLVTTVGCGDAYLGAFLGKYLSGASLIEAFRYGAFAAYLRGKNNAFPTLEEIEELKKQK